MVKGPQVRSCDHPGDGLTVEVLSTQEAAAFLRRSPASIRNMVLRRQIPYRKPGGRLIFVKEELVEWIRSSPGVSIEEVRKEVV